MIFFYLEKTQRFWCDRSNFHGWIQPASVVTWISFIRCSFISSMNNVQYVWNCNHQRCVRDCKRVAREQASLGRRPVHSASAWHLAAPFRYVPRQTKCLATRRSFDGVFWFARPGAKLRLGQCLTARKKACCATGGRAWVGALLQARTWQSDSPAERRKCPSAPGSTARPRLLPHMVTLTWPGARNVPTAPPHPTTSWPGPSTAPHGCAMTEIPLSSTCCPHPFICFIWSLQWRNCPRPSTPWPYLPRRQIHTAK
jgi:hypothetical protein